MEKLVDRLVFISSHNGEIENFIIIIASDFKRCDGRDGWCGRLQAILTIFSGQTHLLAACTVSIRQTFVWFYHHF